MKTDLLKLLRADAKAWHWNKRLRERGDIATAEQRERESVLNKVTTIREVLEAHKRGHAYMRVGDAGSSINYGKSENCTTSVQGYGFNHQVELLPLLAMGVPMIDMRGECGLPVAFRAPLIALSSKAVDPEEKWGSCMACVPAHVAFERVRELGAKVINA